MMMQWAGPPEEYEIAGADVWFQPGYKASFPTLNTEWLTEMAGFLLDNKKQATLRVLQSCVNWMYVEEDLKAPWVDAPPSWARIGKTYKKQRTIIAIENEQDSAETRGTLPAVCIESAVDQALAWPDKDPRVSEVALIVTGAILALRASSMYWEEQDVIVLANGGVRIRSQHVKTRRHATFSQIRYLPAAPAGTPRAKLIRLIKKAIAGRGMNIISSSRNAAAEVTTMMKGLFPSTITGLDKGMKLTSHSLRKTGASALALLCTGPQIGMIMFPWGGWSKGSESAPNYVDAEYVPSAYHAQMYDFLFAPGAIGATTVEHVELDDEGTHTAI